MANALKNVTFSLPVDLVEKLKSLAKDNYIPSLNAGVKEALEAYTRLKEREKLKIEMEKAAKDPLFMDDLYSSMDAFDLFEGDLVSDPGDETW
jgi:hypothetical protein